MSAFHCESWFTESKVASSGCLSVILSPSNTKDAMLQVDKFPTLSFELLADIINQSFNVKTLDFISLLFTTILPITLCIFRLCKTSSYNCEI